ncbi:MAG: hypothetical protein MZV65_00575 [Chromatiales bacterium]|nr:hypothetical protein [Chromatiales bacterium]
MRGRESSTKFNADIHVREKCGPFQREITRDELTVMMVDHGIVLVRVKREHPSTDPVFTQLTTDLDHFRNQAVTVLERVAKVSLQARNGLISRDVGGHQPSEYQRFSAWTDRRIVRLQQDVRWTDGREGDLAQFHPLGGHMVDGSGRFHE